MSAPALGMDEPPVPSLTRWGGSLLLVLGAHAVALVGMQAWRVPMEEALPPPAAVMLDLAPLPAAPPAAPPAEPMELPPPLETVIPEPEPPPEPVVEPEPPPTPVPVPAEVALPEPPKPKPKPKEPPKPTPPKVERPQPRADAKPTPAATTAPAPPAPVAAAPASGPVSTTVSNAVPTWQGLVLSHLERHKRYPRAAQARRQTGVAQVRFTLDRQGRVLSARLEKTSGHESLDEETVAMVERASPLPAPPPEMTQDRIELVVPVQFFLR